ncbi:hypothetical protein R3X27_10095 [Tropicimonas sp. TH_r6]|uniref:hypothetical protein n=1 Tax=Tropicimonas sp. TH_r6 TaxID=3082085 RepID=UPI0029558D54|nr:hypothetical protein [Tropicimonas sp. TH_r6]MDV7143035.1 hypothetical protein [Tropicimonas sp. TH_r6]
MNRQSGSAKNTPVLRPLSIRRAANGETFDIASDSWPLTTTGKNARFDFSWCNDALTPNMKAYLKEAVALRLQRCSVGTETGNLSAIRRLLEWISAKHRRPINMVMQADVSQYRLSFPCSTDCNIKYVVEAWQELEQPGFELGAQFVLEEIPQVKADQLHILTLDPNKGPHLEDELAMVDLVLQAEYDKKDEGISAAQYVLVQIFRLYGQRPSMVSNLKLGDVRTPRHHNEDTSIRFPLLKQPKGEALRYGPRRPAPMLFTHALEEYLDELNMGASATEWDLDSPLFPAKTDSFSISKKKGDRVKALNSEGQRADGFHGHATRNTLSDRYKAILTSLKIVSPRTGKPMVFNPARDRHTIATIMAMRGCSAEEIAAWLHHSDVHSCQAYIELAWQHHQLMSSFLDGKFVHEAGLFLGDVIEGDPESYPSHAVISASEIDTAPNIGACADGGCEALEVLAAPYACFLCRNFHLSINADLGPLVSLLVERKKEANRWGDDEYGRTLNRHIAAVLAAERRQREWESARKTPRETSL